MPWPSPPSRCPCIGRVTDCLSVCTLLDVTRRKRLFCDFWRSSSQHRLGLTRFRSCRTATCRVLWLRAICGKAFCECVKAMLKWLIVPIVVYGALVALVYAAQRLLQYFPERRRTAPSAIGLANAEE